MINIYVQGSKLLGLGHLSRIIPIYKELESCYNNVNLYFHGDEVGESYLKINMVDFISLNTNQIEIKNNEKWIIDSTDIYEKKIEKAISKSKTVVLLSPKFNFKKNSLFTHAILRSDPFSLSIKNKFISKDFLIFNKGEYERKTGVIRLGIALSGSDVSEKITALINSIINNKKFSDKIYSLKIFMGSSQKISFERKTESSYSIDLEFISSFSSLWKFQNNLDLLIIGNGTIVDECIFVNQDFILYNYNKSPIKSASYNTFKEKVVCDLNTLKNYLESYLFKIMLTPSNKNTFKKNHNHLMISKLKEIIDY